jgi:hypothetical protein
MLLLAAHFARAAPDEPKLAIERLTLHQSEDGPPIPVDLEFVPGEAVYFSCQIAGYKKVEKDFEKSELSLTYTVEARDARGVLVVPIQNDKLATTVAPEDKNWMPKIRSSFVVPNFAGSGVYQILIKAKDDNSGSEAEAVQRFTVHGSEVASSDILVVRNFRFLRGEEDQSPLDIPAFRPGDTVWARFDMIGYKLGDKNQLDLEYGLTVLRPTGEVTYSQAHAAQEKTQTFYPQRYTPGVLSLSLPKDLKLGQYTIVLTVRDNVGGQTYETREKFSVE